MNGIPINKTSGTNWTKAEDYIWRDGYLIPSGKIEAYNPFDRPEELYADFYKLIGHITRWRDAYFYEKVLEARKPARYKPKTMRQEEERVFCEAYRRFALRWGLLGVGYSRIIDFSHTVSKNGVQTTSASVRRLVLREAPDIFGWNISEKNTMWVILCPDKLPELGGDVLIENWEESYRGLHPSKYSERLEAVTASYDVLAIREDLENPTGDPFVFYSMEMQANESGISWRFNSLLQAISIIHALNKFEKTWAICPVCKEIFTPRDPRQQYCADKCKATANKRQYRQKRKELQQKEGDINADT